MEAEKEAVVKENLELANSVAQHEASVEAMKQEILRITTTQRDEIVHLCAEKSELMKHLQVIHLVLLHNFCFPFFAVCMTFNSWHLVILVELPALVLLFA